MRRRENRILVSTLVKLQAFATIVALVALAGGAGAAERKFYKASVSWTSHGIPHIRAHDWGGLGYGHGYAFARENLCVLAQETLEVTGTKSRFLGPSGGNLESDFFWAHLNSKASTQRRFESLDYEMRELLRGYAAGYNRHLRDAGKSRLPLPCRDADWVRPISALDLVKSINKLTLLFGSVRFSSSIVGAQPPNPVLATTASDGTATRYGSEPIAASAKFVGLDAPPVASNGIALGGDLTIDGGGAVLANPHFPWMGINRFSAVHLTIPGRYDVMGAALYGFPLVQIGFNRSLSWTHTVSTGQRFVLFELTLAPDDPTSYIFDGDVIPMTSEKVEVGVLQSDGSVALASHTFYSTRWGPMVALPPLAAWSTDTAYTIADINTENTRLLAQWRDIGKAQSVDELEDAIESTLGLPWVNSIAADREGNAYYGDISTVPHVTDEKLAACAKSPVAKLLLEQRPPIFTLDGSTSSCDLGSDSDAPSPGIFGASNLPHLHRRDYTQNSNDSYWLTNPASPIVGFPRIVGTEGSQLSLRGRLGITQIEDRAAGRDGLPGSGFDRKWLQDVLYQNRNHSAELILPDVSTVCSQEDNLVDVGGGLAVDVSKACAILRDWDATNNPDSIGPHVWLEFFNRIGFTPNLFAVPFDDSDPTRTPRGLNVDDSEVRRQVMVALAGAVERLDAAEIPLDRAWGEVFFDTRSDEILPMHGGPAQLGVYNVMTPAGLADRRGYTPIVHGSSYIHAVSWRHGWPLAEGIVTYSQSTDPDSRHFSDMTRIFSDQDWIKFPYRRREIRRDLIERIVLKERRKRRKSRKLKKWSR